MREISCPVKKEKLVMAWVTVGGGVAVVAVSGREEVRLCRDGEVSLSEKS